MRRTTWKNKHYYPMNSDQSYNALLITSKHAKWIEFAVTWTICGVPVLCVVVWATRHLLVYAHTSAARKRLALPYPNSHPLDMFKVPNDDMLINQIFLWHKSIGLWEWQNQQGHNSSDSGMSIYYWSSCTLRIFWTSL